MAKQNFKIKKTFVKLELKPTDHQSAIMVTTTKSQLLVGITEKLSVTVNHASPVLVYFN